ncbi:hypothetical protein H6P81_011464 [Aristolochia fimbriata]|uniref:Uncharacterized protein n=1 Tax=Aristolochia fimbriata TaxID=158543 RepID=A0AAV7ESB4_ARIFI|nr:hypothetical protein H6P81_011464 [Aristolochia fimbriata]
MTCALAIRDPCSITRDHPWSQRLINIYLPPSIQLQGSIHRYPRRRYIDRSTTSEVLEKKGEGMSIDALAMSGADYVQCGIDFDEHEEREAYEVPPYLLADEGIFVMDYHDEGDHGSSAGSTTTGTTTSAACLVGDMKFYSFQVKLLLVAWAKKISESVSVLQ